MKIAFALATLLLCSVFLVASTGADGDSLKIYQISPVRVVAELPGQSGANLEIMEIGTKSLFLNAREALSTLSGLSASTGAKDESSIKIRGFRKTDLKFMVDGRPLTTGYFGNVDLNSMGLSDIEYLSIIRGPSSGAMGTGTMGGAINFIRQQPSRDSHLKLGLAFKRNNTHSMLISAAHDFESWNYRLSGARHHTDGFALSKDFEPTAFENGGIRNHSGRSLHSISGSLETDLGLVHSLGFSGGFSHQARKLIPSSIYESRYRAYENWKRSDATLRSTFYTGDASSLKTSLYWDQSSDRYLEYLDSSQSQISLDSSMYNYSLGLFPVFSYEPGPKARLSSGLRLEQHNTKRKDNGTYPDWTRFSYYSNNSFIAADLAPSEKLTLNASLALNQFLMQDAKKSRWSLDPVVFVEYKADDKSSYSASLGINSSNPTMRQLFSAAAGNMNLEPQKAIKAEISAARMLKMGGVPMQAKLVLFHDRVSSLIERQAGIYQNLIGYSSYGCDASLLLRVFGAWEMDLTYSYFDYYDAGEYRITESPRHSAGMVQRLSLPFEIDLRLNSSLVGRRQSIDATDTYHELEGYLVHDLVLSRGFGRHRLSLTLENLTDRFYFLEYGYPAGGLNFGVGVEMVF